ncbi:uracil-DNA glycosylase [Variovorax robiniae]|uniref:Uracil-DNA glycosylase n=1 Tax=Variovorax robiniae TaxID=1836199 RepID=A0ABU8XFH4_9BURK
MSALALDARQRAMLEEMGVKVWWPAEPAAESTAEPGARVAAPAPGLAQPALAGGRPEAPRAAPAEVAPRPSPAAPTAVAPAPAPASRASAGEEVTQIEPPQRLYGGPAAQGGWLIVVDMPPQPDGRHGEPFAGEAGRLLDNMLRALQLDTGAVPVHLMRTHRGATASASPSQPFAQSFDGHLAAVAPRMVLAMGPLAAQCLLRRNEPIGKLRGQADGLPGASGVQVVATYHPAYLLRNRGDKAKAWADLCLAAARFGV